MLFLSKHHDSIYIKNVSFFFLCYAFFHEKKKKKKKKKKSDSTLKGVESVYTFSVIWQYTNILAT